MTPAERSSSWPVSLLGLGEALTTLCLDSWRRVVLASLVPFVARTVWHTCRTVIEVTDSEQSLWIRMWLGAQTDALSRVRVLRLLSPSDKMGRHGMDNPYSHLGRGNLMQKAKEEDDKEEEGGRFAPPKLEFQPAHGISAWTFLGGWPVSVKGNQAVSDPLRGRYRGEGYTITVWFAPWGTTLAKQLLLEGRRLWLAKRAQKTEIWMPSRRRLPTGGFKILTRPSRPLSTVIVMDGIKQTLMEDVKVFLGAEHWYVGKGIPYRRGILLEGPPGCGKTSLVTALAGELRLPIVFIQLNGEDMDDTQLLEVMGEAPRDSIVLMEDIDCALRSEEAVVAKKDDNRKNRYGRTPVTLSGLLNAIDGVGAQEGRLLFMTTNYVERLDEALIRPGRVDVKFHLGKATRAAAGELFDQFFASSLADGTFGDQVVASARTAFLASVDDDRHSFAALQGVLMMGRDDPLVVEQGMKDLVEAANAAAAAELESKNGNMEGREKPKDDSKGAEAQNNCDG